MPCKHPKTCDACSVGLPVIDGLGGDPRPWLPGAQRLGGQITDAALGAPPEPGASADGSLENAQRRRGADRGERADRPELDLRVVLASGARAQEHLSQLRDRAVVPRGTDRADRRPSHRRVWIMHAAENRRSRGCPAHLDGDPHGLQPDPPVGVLRSEEHTSELQSLAYLVCRLLLEKKKRSFATVPKRSTTI